MPDYTPEGAEIVRVGVTLYPSYVERCILKYKDLFNVGPDCANPGISVKVFIALQEALKDQFYFELIRIDESKGAWISIVEAFDKGWVDLSIDLWTKNVKRVEQAYLSEPLIYKRRSFLTSSLNANVQASEMDILPLAKEVIMCFGGAAIILAIILAFAKVVQKQQLITDFSEGVRTFWDQLKVATWKFIQVLLKQPVGLSKFNKSWTTTLAWFPWFFAGLMVVSMYDAVVTTELLPQRQLPFSDSLQLAEKVKTKALQLIVEDPTAPFYQLIATSNSPVYRALNLSIITYPVLDFDNDEVIGKLRGNRHYVYATNTVAAKFIMGQDCDLIEIEDTAAEYSGLNLAFPNNSTLPDRFRTAIVMMHSVIDRMIKSVGSNRCFAQKIEVKPMPVEYLKTAFVVCGIGLAISIGVFILETPCIKRQAEQNRALGVAMQVVGVGGGNEGADGGKQSRLSHSNKISVSSVDNNGPMISRSPAGTTGYNDQSHYHRPNTQYERF